MSEHAVRLLVGFLPVLLFLLCLIWLDSYKLVALRIVLLVIGAGSLTAGLGWVANAWLLGRLELEPALYSRYAAPLVEEGLKSSVLIGLIRSHRVGFLVDAAILGFAVGAGFAVVENAYYLRSLPDASLATWIVRGFGTAIMHGGTTTIFALLSKAAADRRDSAGWMAFLPAWLAAVAIHSFYNHFFLSPVLSTLVILLTLPLLVMLAFRRSEKSLEDWLGVGFDADAELLELIHSGRLSGSRIGSYLQSLRESFRGEVVADMLCYLRLHTELALRAKGELLMRESGFHTEISAETREKLAEMKYLERSIGKTGRLAMAPFLRLGGKELWQVYMLERQSGG